VDDCLWNGSPTTVTLLHTQSVTGISLKLTAAFGVRKGCFIQLGPWEAPSPPEGSRTLVFSVWQRTQCSIGENL
jgi:hypothetical protein